MVNLLHEQAFLFPVFFSTLSQARRQCCHIELLLILYDATATNVPQQSSVSIRTTSSSVQPFWSPHSAATMHCFLPGSPVAAKRPLPAVPGDFIPLPMMPLASLAQEHWRHQAQIISRSGTPTCSLLCKESGQRA